MKTPIINKLREDFKPETDLTAEIMALMTAKLRIPYSPTMIKYLGLTEQKAKLQQAQDDLKMFLELIDEFKISLGYIGYFKEEKQSLFKKIEELEQKLKEKTGE